MSSHTLELAAAAASLRAAASTSKTSLENAIDDREDDEEVVDVAGHGRMSSLRPMEASSLDVTEIGSASSLKLPHSHVLTSDRVRRRSELSRHPPLDSPPAIEPETIELPVIKEYAGPYSRGTSSGIRPTDISFQNDVVFSSQKDDVEIAPSFPSSLAPSIRIDEDTDSTAPVMSTAQKAALKRKRLTNFMTLCFVVFMNGWNDGTTGPLLPRIQEYYGIGFAMVSLIFVFNAVGYVAAAVANVYLTDRFGFGKVMLFGSVLQIAAYAMLFPPGPFPLMCVGFTMIGFGLALQNAHCNGYVAASKENVPTKIGYLHASYGCGALVSPLIATQFSKQSHWSYHYLISGGLYALNSILLWFVFRGRRQEEIKKEVDDLSPDQDAIQTNKYKQIFSIRAVHIFALFSLIYVGTEVTIGGWSVTYVQEKRHGNSNAGYISSGFFAGLMLGRILLMWLNKKIGERRALFLYALLAIQLEVTVWVVPSLVENAVAVAFVGMLLGPMYPILLNHSTKILPRWLLTGCMGYIAGIGQAGSAVLPFLTGLLASRFGITSLQPFIVSMMSTMIVIWAFIPRARMVPV
ncbi:MFS general substrate transporter [Lentinus tigrinus ALCF2SS1-6]|uniref:MFS general substrate transporter n=1 Tax=Lentinus tigrinus ALCF2SS1-6 TaxID=1328759 RepID=A0A5C2RY46_9APHY|nr:MFS general substrate transporter [Lentinus tigrinus ALCF2SS1-6]